MPGMPSVSIPGLGPLLTAMRLQTEALAMLPNTLVALNRSLEAFAEAMSLATTSMAAVQQLADRIDTMVEMVEAPVRALSPGMRRLASVLDDPVIDNVPSTLRRMSSEVTPLVIRLADTEAMVSGIASSTEHIRRLVSETGDLMGGLSAAPARPPRAANAPAARLREPTTPAAGAEDKVRPGGATKDPATKASTPRSAKVAKPPAARTTPTKPTAGKSSTATSAKPARRPSTGR